jgi:hypothetical protein
MSAKLFVLISLVAFALGQALGAQGEPEGSPVVQCTSGRVAMLRILR